jgi:hypothetical protein
MFPIWQHTILISQIFLSLFYVKLHQAALLCASGGFRISAKYLKPTPMYMPSRKNSKAASSENESRQRGGCQLQT